MVKDRIYLIDEIQSVWNRWHYHPNTVLYSDDNGVTWKEPPSMDTGKWELFTIINGDRIDWIFKTR